MVVAPLNMISAGVVTHPQFASLDAWLSRGLVGQSSIMLAATGIKTANIKDDVLMTGDVESVELELSKHGDHLVWELQPGRYIVTGEVQVRIPKPGLVGVVKPSAIAMLANVEVPPVQFGYGADQLVEYFIVVTEPIKVPKLSNLGELEFKMYELPKHGAAGKAVGAAASYDNSRSYI